MYELTTNNIRILVAPRYIEQKSSPDQNHYFWAYRILIENNGNICVQLRDRYWKITDCTGKVEEVRGPGVVGEQPILQPGERFEYTSGCPLTVPSGFMTGGYTMITEDGTLFEVAIPDFSLDLPGQTPALN